LWGKRTREEIRIFYGKRNVFKEFLVISLLIGETMKVYILSDTENLFSKEKKELLESKLEVVYIREIKPSNFVKLTIFEKKLSFYKKTTEPI